MRHSNFDNYTESTNVRIKNPLLRFIKVFMTVGQWIHPKITSNFVRKKIFTPVTKPVTEIQKNWMDNALNYTIKTKGKNISGWKIGKGPSILFVHGWNGRGVQLHHFFQPALNDGYSIVFFDAPAHGKSEGEITNYLEVTESLNAIFNHEIGKEIAGVIAHSMGASAVINHMSRYHHEIPLVLIAPPLRLLELLITSFQMHGVPRQIYLNLIREVEQTFQLPLDTQNPIDLIYTLSNKILIIHDAQDRLTPIGPSIRIAGELENVELIQTNGFGHNHLLRKMEVVRQAIHFIDNQLNLSINTDTEKVISI